MIFAAILVILVDSRDAYDPSTEALARTARTALGEGSTVSVVDRNDPTKAPSDSDPASKDAAVVDLHWNDDAHEHARIRLRRGRDGAWIERTITFEPFDQPAERGRAVAYAVTAMLATVTPAAQEHTPIASASEADKGATTPPPPAPIAEPHKSRAPIGAVVATGFVVRDLAGVDNVFGGALVGDWYASRHVGLRVGGLVGAGRVDEVQASLFELGVTLGVRFQLVPATPENHLSLGVNLDALVLYQSLSHFSDDDPKPVLESRWVPGGALMLEGGWAISGGAAALVLGVGSQILAGKLEVYTHERDAARLSQFRFVGALGVRTQF